MAFDLFGFTINRKKEELPSFVPNVKDDGAVVVEGSGAYGTYLDIEGAISSEAELIDRYRDMATYPQVEHAIDEIVNELVVQEPETKPVELILDDLKGESKKVQDLIIKEFDTVLDLLEFNESGHDVAERWYVDGRLLYHAIVDPNNIKEGIQELRYIDPRKIRKIRELAKNRNKVNTSNKIEEEYYIYNDKGFRNAATTSYVNNTSASGIKIAKDSIIHCTSGLQSPDGNMIHSHLHKAIRPLNMLRSMEDALLIYTISRAPERRVFYIDVGDIPPAKAAQILAELQNKYKNKVVFNNQTGEIGNDKRHMTMLEDFWLLRQNGKNTEISGLPGGTALFSSLDGIEYFNKKLNESLSVPVSRLDSNSLFSGGTETTNEEEKFDKFIIRLRQKFSQLFLKILEKQLILKGIITVDDWDRFNGLIKFKFAVNNHRAELKDNEILNTRLAAVGAAMPYVGLYISHEEIRRKILRQSDEDIKRIDKQIKSEKTNPQYIQEPTLDNTQPDMSDNAKSKEDPKDNKKQDDDEEEESTAVPMTQNLLNN